MNKSHFTLDELRELAGLADLSESDLATSGPEGSEPGKEAWFQAVREAARQRGQTAFVNQQDVIRQGLLSGLSNREICERVRTLFPDSSIKPRQVPWTIHSERSRRTEWWRKHGEEVAEHRDIKV